MNDFEELKQTLREAKRDYRYIEIEYLMDMYHNDPACYNYLLSVYWKIAKYNLEILKRNFG